MLIIEEGRVRSQILSMGVLSVFLRQKVSLKVA
jgi:hypothetical protein